MKLRRQRKLAQAKVRHGNGYNWWFESFIRQSITHFKTLPEAMQEVFYERQLQQE
jgi:hypothetical protein